MSGEREEKEKRGEAVVHHQHTLRRKKKRTTRGDQTEHLARQTLKENKREKNAREWHPSGDLGN